MGGATYCSRSPGRDTRYFFNQTSLVHMVLQTPCPCPFVLRGQPLPEGRLGSLRYGRCSGPSGLARSVPERRECVERLIKALGVCTIGGNSAADVFQNRELFGSPWDRACIAEAGPSSGTSESERRSSHLTASRAFRAGFYPSMYQFAERFLITRRWIAPQLRDSSPIPQVRHAPCAREAFQASYCHCAWGL